MVAFCHCDRILEFKQFIKRKSGFGLMVLKVLVYTWLALLLLGLILVGALGRENHSLPGGWEAERNKEAAELHALSRIYLSDLTVS